MRVDRAHDVRIGEALGGVALASDARRRDDPRVAGRGEGLGQRHAGQPRDVAWPVKQRPSGRVQIAADRREVTAGFVRLADRRRTRRRDGGAAARPLRGRRTSGGGSPGAGRTAGRPVCWLRTIPARTARAARSPRARRRGSSGRRQRDGGSLVRQRQRGAPQDLGHFVDAEVGVERSRVGGEGVPNAASASSRRPARAKSRPRVAEAVDCISCVLRPRGAASAPAGRKLFTSGPPGGTICDGLHGPHARYRAWGHGSRFRGRRALRAIAAERPFGPKETVPARVR